MLLITILKETINFLVKTGKSLRFIDCFSIASHVII